MQIAAQLLFLLTLVLCGGYAGMVLMCQIGVLPAMRDLSLSAFADAWRAMDSYMERLMPPYKLSLLLINAAAFVVVILQHRNPILAFSLGASFLCSAAGLVLTVRGQLPLNAQIKTPGLPAEILGSIREKTIAGFRVRFILAALAFLVLCVGVVFSPLSR